MNENIYKRLEVAEKFIEFTEEFADIGCDHGYLSEYALKNGLAKNVVACDISDKSLDKARENLKSYKNVQYVCADGASVVGNFGGTVAICGLGGGEIIRIIQNARAKTLILQPQNFVSGVRRALNECGYKIVGDSLAYERKKFYDVIKASKGSQQLSPEEYEWGAFIDEPSQLLKDRLAQNFTKISKYKQTPENIHKLQIIEMAQKRQNNENNI